MVVDLGQPKRFWHLIPGIGRLNWRIPILTCDAVVLNGYLVINASTITADVPSEAELSPRLWEKWKVVGE